MFYNAMRIYIADIIYFKVYSLATIGIDDGMDNERKRGAMGTRRVILEGKITKSIEFLRDEQVMYIPHIDIYNTYISYL